MKSYQKMIFYKKYHIFQFLKQTQKHQILSGKSLIEKPFKKISKTVEFFEFERLLETKQVIKWTALMPN